MTTASWAALALLLCLTRAPHGLPLRRHPDCVEYLATNGADPLVCDERRHNTCLHFAALYGHSDCVNKLLGSRTAARGHQVRAADPGEGGVRRGLM